MNRIILIGIVLAIAADLPAQTHADTLRGSQSLNRTWWNVLKYDIDASFDAKQKSVSGNNTITYKQVQESRDHVLQIDLMAPMTIDSVVANNKKLNFTKDGNAWFIKEQSQSSDIRKL